MTALTLRPYQSEAIASVFAEWERGVKRTLGMAATGMGKTVIFLSTVDEILKRQPDARVLIIAHRSELISQPIERAKQFYHEWAGKMGVVMAGQNDSAAQVVVATIQTLAGGNCKRANEIASAGKVDYFVIDECFVAGTLVDGKPIEDVRLGDLVWAWDGQNKRFEFRPVTRLFRKPAPKTLRTVYTTAGQFTCTGNHPVYTVNRGWVEAGVLTAYDYLLTGGANYARVIDITTTSETPDGYVYNLEVDDLHTYTANGHVVHNCHHMVASTYLKVAEALGEPFTLGVTATPKRTDHLALGTFFSSVAFRFSIEAGIREGALTPFIPLGYYLDMGETELASDDDDGEDKKAKSLGDILSADNVLEVVYKHWHEMAANRQTLGFCASVSHAHAAAKYFRGQGVTAEAVDGTTPKEERAAILDRYQKGETQAVFNFMVLSEGFDAPQTSCIIRAAPTKSDLTIVQQLGRGLRPYPGKEDCIVLDFAPKGWVDFMTVGDILDGDPLNRAQKKAVKKAEKQGLLFGFRVGKEGIGAIDPGEIQMRVLDYFRAQPIAWTSDGIFSAAALDANNVLVMVVPDTDRISKAESLRRMGQLSDAGQRLSDYLKQYRLYKVWRRPAMSKDDRPGEWQVELRGAFPTLETAQAQADRLGQGYAGNTIGGRKKEWRREPMTPAQAGFLKRLNAYQHGLTKGQAAQRITFVLARQQVEAIEKRREKSAYNGL